MTNERKSGKATHRIIDLDAYLRGTIRRAMLKELRQVLTNPEYAEKHLQDMDAMKIGKDEKRMFHIFLESVEESASKTNFDLMKIHQDSIWMLDNIKTELDDLFKQSVEAEKRLKAASTQYEAAIFKSIEETSEAINGAYQRLTAIDQNLVKLENSMKMEMQTRLANLAQKFEEIREGINATLKENKERIAYLWQQIEDSEKRIKDATMTSERNVLSSIDGITAQVESFQGTVLELQTMFEQNKEETRGDLVQVGNELMEALTQNTNGIQTIDATVKDMRQKLTASMEQRLDAMYADMSEKMDTAVEALNKDVDAKLDSLSKSYKKDSQVLIDHLTSLKGELEVLKHIALDAIKTGSRR
ncbi:MAG: hypothetical protein L0Z54_06205 [Thermoplasmata archaeon]|nr:hypothetical protein [Thermoplasmata archaeon]